LRLQAETEHNPGVHEAQAEIATLPLRVQDEVECRHCEVHCEKVVHPGACLRTACPFVYAYEAWGHTYMGCLQKVFDVEIDLDLLRARASARRSGSSPASPTEPPSHGSRLLAHGGAQTPSPHATPTRPTRVPLGAAPDAGAGA